jgi:sigma-B regulation protein RsbU (phosphoserine phosphatase)
LDTTVLENLKHGLITKQQNLLEFLHKSPSAEKTILLGPSTGNDVQSHLSTIEDSIAKADAGTLGRCEICQEPVETRLIEADYTACICLEHFSSEEMNRLEGELELAQSVQKTLLPQEVPDIVGMEIAAFTKPAQIVGGDYFDFFKLNNGDYGFVIADVAGHGVSAGLHMASIQAMLHSIVPRSDSPAEILNHIHQLFIHNIRFTTFVSIFIATYNSMKKTLLYANAGHNPPILLHKLETHGYSVQRLAPTGAAVGLIEDAEFGQELIDLESGDYLVMYTDGVIEAINDRFEQFGNERLINTLQTLNGVPPVDVIRGLRLELDHFMQGQFQEDDTTVIAFRIQ